MSTSESPLPEEYETALRVGVLGVTMLPERSEESRKELEQLLEKFKTVEDFQKWMREKESGDVPGRDSTAP